MLVRLPVRPRKRLPGREHRFRRIASLTLCALLVVGVLSACHSDENTAMLNGAIQDGVRSQLCDWPAVVHMGDACTGALITPTLVAYAGHCGTTFHDITIDSDGGARIQVPIVECASPYAENPQADVAFCTLERPLFNISIPPVLSACSAQTVEPGSEVAVVGAGQDGPFGTQGTEKYFWGTIVDLSETAIVVQIDSGGTCRGDSGGPVYTMVDGSWRTLGVVSRGDAPICDVSLAYAVPINKWINWIEKHLNARASPCELHGQQLATPSCQRAVVDHLSDGSFCHASIDVTAQPCPNSEVIPTALMDSSHVTRLPADGSILRTSALLQVGVSLEPLDTEAVIDIELISPLKQSHRKRFEYPPYLLDVPALTPGEWRVVAKFAGTALPSQVWAFTTRDMAVTTPGCSVTRTRPAVLSAGFVPLLVAVFLSRRRRSQ
jgi:hypothetical protein